MQALVIGGNGFIGTNLVLRLLKDGYTVRVYDRADSYFLDRLSGVEYIYGELGNIGSITSALSGVEIVYHLAATTKPESSNNDPAFDVVSNVADSIHLFEQCVKEKVKRVIFISSGGTVYGIPNYIPINEVHSTEPICSYGITKLTIEKYLSLFKRLHGLEYIVLRVSNPFGPFQNPFSQQGAIAVFMYKIFNKLPITIWGDGAVVRDYLFIEDLIDALLKASQITITDHNVFNISSGKGISLNKIISEIEYASKQKADVQYRPSRKFDVQENVLDNQLALNHLEWKPSTSLQDGLKKTIIGCRK
jgi:UDP-glucose 4-epimerase